MADTGRKILIATAMAGGLLSIAPPAAAQSASVAAAATPKWSVKVAPGRCTLNRSTDENTTHAGISLDTYAGSDSYRFAMAGPDMIDHTAGDLFPLVIVFHDADRRFDRKGVSVPVGSLRANSVSGLGDDFIDAFAQSASVSFADQTHSSAAFPLPRAKAAIQAFTQCVNDQLVEWGADPAQFAPGGKKPVALKDRDGWMSNAQLLEMPIDKMVLDARFRVSIAPDGSIDSCARIDSDDKDSVERVACNAVKAKRLFTPATGPDGKPVRGAASFEIHLIKRPNLR